MADQDTDDTEWVLMKHARFPFPDDHMIGGPYKTREDAMSALRDVEQHGQWFTTYGIEHRKVQK